MPPMVAWPSGFEPRRPSRGYHSTAFRCRRYSLGDGFPPAAVGDRSGHRCGVSTAGTVGTGVVGNRILSLGVSPNRAARRMNNSANCLTAIRTGPSVGSASSSRDAARYLPHKSASSSRAGLSTALTTPRPIKSAMVVSQKSAASPVRLSGRLGVPCSRRQPGRACRAGRSLQADEPRGALVIFLPSLNRPIVTRGAHGNG